MASIILTVSWAAEKSIQLNLFEAIQIPLLQLQELIKKRHITFRPGDILFTRTGFTEAYDVLIEAGQVALSQRLTASFSGVELSEATFRSLWESQFAVVAGDSSSFEFVLYEWLLAGQGMSIGEIHSLFVNSMPLKVPGGVASPPNAVDIF
ncbi:hypothetical protein CC78DRAFT_551537 [Lojkania enalia]|uniref:Uncharacterized protein n=1 Tax=Lojkania enalia TaxID=147567 RepID=A0A9P4KFV0_9PLEO|nr:hypothetical protein CC78DRAFT_551537 [Didymosphaeria enalia]